MSLLLYDIGTEDFSEAARVIVIEYFGHVLKVEGAKLSENFEFLLVHFLEYILLVMRFEKFSFSFTASRLPWLSAENGFDPVGVVGLPVLVVYFSNLWDEG